MQLINSSRSPRLLKRSPKVSWGIEFEKNYEICQLCGTRQRKEGLVAIETGIKICRNHEWCVARIKEQVEHAAVHRP